MADNPSAPPEPFVLTLTFSPQTGEVHIAGPLHDKVLCYGILEAGKDAVRRFDPRKAVGRPAGLVLPEFGMR